MADRERPSLLLPEDLRARLRERLSALRGELERLRFETDRRWDELLARLAERPEEILPEELLRIPLSERSLAYDAVSSDSARRLDRAGNQVEALNCFLEECRRHASRALLLVERGGRMEIWKSAGFDRSREEEKRISLPLEGRLARVREGVPQRLSSGNEISRALGASDAADAVIVPFVVREKVSGAVYADAKAEEGHLDTEGIALLTWVAGVVVDRLAKRKLVPSPALRGFESSSAATSFDSPPSFASVPPAERPAAPLPREDGISAMPSGRAPEPARPPEPPTDAPRERMLGGPLAPPAENERRDEARRFARLLASEIKLYNEREVSVGRERGDLYARLKEDIERGRRLYEERVPADVRSGADYFHEELVQVLANGRAEALK
jgi:hypothetical protein